MRKSRKVVAAFGVALLGGLGLVAAQTMRSSGGMTVPSYLDGKELVQPEGYRKWVFVGASIGLSYSENNSNANPGPGRFDHIYIQPEAYAEYERTGRFPEKTMLVMEVHDPEQKVSINKQGYFEGKRVALEVAVKDRATFEDGWAYFDFGNGAKKSARAFATERCYSCHKQHGASDNVFTQFYPALRDLKK